MRTLKINNLLYNTNLNCADVYIRANILKLREKPCVNKQSIGHLNKESKGELERERVPNDV